MPLAFARRAFAELTENRSSRLAAQVDRVRGSYGVRALGRDNRADRGDPEFPGSDVVDDLTTLGTIGRARKLGTKQFLEREAAG